MVILFLLGCVVVRLFCPLLRVMGLPRLAGGVLIATEQLAGAITLQILAIPTYAFIRDMVEISDSPTVIAVAGELRDIARLLCDIAREALLPFGLAPEC